MPSTSAARIQASKASRFWRRRSRPARNSSAGRSSGEAVTGSVAPSPAAVTPSSGTVPASLMARRLGAHEQTLALGGAQEVTHQRVRHQPVAGLVRARAAPPLDPREELAVVGEPEHKRAVVPQALDRYGEHRKERARTHNAPLPV